MTTTANKHGLRKAAGERRTKHTQKTPLPPKRERVLAEEAGLVKKRADERKAALAPAANEGSKSLAKAKAFSAEVARHGWSAVSNHIDAKQDHIAVLATRGNESINIEWMNGVYQATATYTIADRTVKVRNASQAKQYAERAPEEAQKELEKVAGNRFFRRRETPEASLERRPLPFDTETATDVEVAEALAGRRVTWHNRFRSESETGVVPKDVRRIYFTTGPDESRIINFNCSIGGARSFRLVALLAVSGQHAAATKRHASAAKRAAAKAAV